MPFEPRRNSNQSDEDAPHGVFMFHLLYYEICNRTSSEVVIWIICSILCVALGFPACVLILRKMWKQHQSGTALTPNSLFILHLTIMDTIFLPLIPFGILNYMIFRQVIVESLWNSLYSLNMIGRPLLMTCMCLDCYVAVVHPITYHKRKSLTPRIVVVCFVWFCTLAISAMFFMFSQNVGLITLCPFVLTTVIVGISDSFIVHALLKSDAGKKSIHQQKKRAIQTLVNSLVMTILFYFPPILMEMLRIGTRNYDVYYCSRVFLASALSTSGSGFMPILYYLNRNKRGGCRFSWCFQKTGNFELRKYPS